MNRFIRWLFNVSEEEAVRNKLISKREKLLVELEELNQKYKFECDDWFVGSFLAERNRKHFNKRMDEIEKEIEEIDKELLI
jgi:hypothetical protein